MVRTDVRPEPIAGGYRNVRSDRPFLRLALTNIAAIAVGWGVFTWILPPYARAEVGIGDEAIGLLLFANAMTVVVAQIPVARFSDGRRRAPAMAIGSLTFVVACLVVLVNTYPAFVAAVIIVGVGECFHTTALMPLAADLAPVALRGRYMATMGVSWWLGLALAPTLGTQLLAISPPGTMLVAAGGAGRDRAARAGRPGGAARPH